MQVPALSQAVARGLTPSSGTFNEDWEAVFAAAGIVTGTFNERLLAWLNGKLGASYASLPSALAAYTAGISAPTLPVFKAAIAGVKARTRRATVLVIGDSTTLGEAGSDSSANSYDGDGVKNSWPAVMAAALASGGVPASFDCFFGDGGCTNYGDFTYSTFNAQFATGGGGTGPFTRANGNQTLGGGVTNVADSGHTGGYWGYNSRGLVTKLRAFLVQSQYGYGVFGYQIDGGSIPTFNVPATTGAQQVFTFDWPTTAKAQHGYAMNRSSGGSLFLLGGYAFDETTPAVDVLNVGNRGSAVADWISTNGSPSSSPDAWSPLGMIGALRPDLVLIMPPINDLEGGTSIASFTASLTTLVQAAKAAGADCHLINAAATRAGGPNSRPAQTVRDTYTAAMRQVATAQGLPTPTDLEALTAPWDATRWRDDLHPYKALYATMGQKVASDLLALTS